LDQRRDDTTDWRILQDDPQTYIHNTYIPCIQKFTKIIVGYGIINIQNVKKIWNFLNTKYYKDVSIILHLKIHEQEEKKSAHKYLLMLL
jgi:hypothetical protein